MSSISDIRVLVVDDEKHICEIIEESLSSEPLHVFATSDPVEAHEYIKNNPVDLVLSDLIMGDHSGVDILDATLQHHVDAIVLLMTAYPTVQTAISVLRKGAYDFLIKPFKLEILRASVRRGLQHQRVVRENLHLKGQVEFLKASNAFSMGTDLEEHLKVVLRSSKMELGATAAAVLKLNPESGDVTSILVESDDDQFRSVVEDESTAQQFLYRKSSSAIVHRREITHNGEKAARVLISKPVLIGRTLHGIINLAIVNRFDRITPGQMDILSILSSSAASAIANQKLYRDLRDSFLQAIRALANSIEARDQYTAGHTDRVVKLARILATGLGWNEQQMRELVVGCTVHDIGKIGVPDSILNKKERLTEEEREKMCEHPQLGLRIIEGIDLFRPCIPYIMAHHERYDGQGYPKGLKGKDIPIEGRLLSVVDTFDAILSDRPYRKGAGVEVAINELLNHRGSQFDPELVNLFIRLIGEGQVDFVSLYDRDEDVSFLTQRELRETEQV
jgi:response regulator RpfG family c-di-GMP phosphodiesterase